MSQNQYTEHELEQMLAAERRDFRHMFEHRNQLATTLAAVRQYVTYDLGVPKEVATEVLAILDTRSNPPGVGYDEHGFPND